MRNRQGIHTSSLAEEELGIGDGSNPISGTNFISTGTKIVPVEPWVPRKTFLSSK